jgi:F-type H+-transporting ATPase subunit b
MQEIIQQIGALLLGSLPTLFLFLVLVFSYQFLVQGPLGRTLKERRARTSGAVEEALKAIATAEARTDEYSNKLRHARAEVFRVREARLQELAHDRDSALDKARKSAMQKVMEAKTGIEQEAGVARKTLMAGADQLAEQVLRAVMPAAAGGSH